MVNSLPNIPLAIDIESKAVLKKLAKAHQALAELKGVAASIPNQSILINTLSEILHHSKKGLQKDERCEKKGVVLI
nr:Fic/DOC family N-terminal domain-containing protein [Pseudanabaena mucicola]